MSAPLARRGFLRGLVSLPLIGGGVTLIGKPTAAAVPVSVDLLEGYKTFLHYEQRWLTWEVADRPDVLRRYRMSPDTPKVDRWHEIERWIHHIGTCASWSDELPSTRAAMVLSAVGRDWRSA